MEKTVKIDGKDVRLKANAKLPLVYRAYFGEEIFKVQIGMISLASKAESASKDKAIKLSISDMAQIDTVGVIKMIWAMAKCADDSIPELEKWLDGFDEMPIFELINDCVELFLSNLTSTTNIKNAEAAGS